VSTALICPDDLLVGARSRTLSTEDRARLDAHLSRCAACRAALSVGRAFDAGLGARPGDDEIARRIAARVAPKRSRRRMPYLLAVGLVLVTGSVAAARSVPAIWKAVQERIDTPSAQLDSKVLQEVTRAARQASKDLGEASRAVVPNVPSVPTATASTPVLAPERRTAAELFAEGNSHRRRGEVDAARRAYDELQRSYPGSTEALVSHVSLGRLEKGRNPGSALRHFNAYLGQSAHTTLAEEALFGKASVLEGMGRASEERATWQQLLRRFPSSVYAERARTRLSSGDVE
jgi:hypothetical protein